MATEAKKTLRPVISDINFSHIARSMGKSPSWLYHKLDNRDGTGGFVDFTPNELIQLSDELRDLARRLDSAAEELLVTAENYVTAKAV